MAASTTIQYYYQSILQRPADAGGLAGFSGLVDSGTLTLAAVRGVMISAPESTLYVMPVIRLYQGALGRVPDAAGLANWVRAMAGGTPLLSIAQGFVGSQEFQNSYGVGTTADLAFITGLYQRILLRVPDAAGLQNWLNAGAAGMSRAAMLLGFTESPESIARWTPPAADFLDTLARNDPYPYASLAETLPPQGTPFTLMGGENNLTGTAGTDVFTAPVVVGADSLGHATLTSLDSLDGGTGEDTLVATLGDDPSLVNAPVVPVLRNIEALRIRAVGLARTLSLSQATGVTSLLDNGSSANLTVNGSGVAGIGTVGVANVGSDTRTALAGLQVTALAVRGLLAGDAARGQYHDLALGFTQPDGSNAVAVRAALSVNLETAMLGLSGSGVALTGLAITTSGPSGVRTADQARAALVFAAGAGITVRGGGIFGLRGAIEGVASLDATGFSGALSLTLVDSALSVLTTGSGGSTVTLATMSAAGVHVALGAGSNVLVLQGALTANSVLDGGGGASLQLQTAMSAASVISGFANVLLTGSGGGIYELAGVAGLPTLWLQGGPQTLVLRRAPVGVALVVQAAGYESSVLTLDVTLGLVSSGAAGLSLVAVDGNGDGFAGAGVGVLLRADSLGGAVTALNLRSGALADPGVAMTAYQNTLDIGAATGLRTLSVQADAALHLVGAAGLVSVTVTGAASVDLGIAGPGLVAVSATAAQGQVQLNATAAVGGVGYGGSAGVDVVSFGAAGANTIQGNGGNDIFILGAGSTDRLVYAAASDAQFLNASGLAGVTLAHDGAGFERVLNFDAGDHVDLSAFHFTGLLARVLDVSASVGAATDLSALAGLFRAGGTNYGVAIAQQAPVGGVSDVLVFVNTAQGTGFTAATGLGFDLRAAPGAVSSASFLF